MTPARSGLRAFSPEKQPSNAVEFSIVAALDVTKPRSPRWAVMTIVIKSRFMGDARAHFGGPFENAACVGDSRFAGSTTWVAEGLRRQ